jgi:hypothetical protein
MLIVLSSTFSASLLPLEVVDGRRIVSPTRSSGLAVEQQLHRIVDQRQQQRGADPLAPAVVDVAVDAGLAERSGPG